MRERLWSTLHVHLDLRLRVSEWVSEWVGVLVLVFCVAMDAISSPFRIFIVRGRF